jgi:transposase
MEPLITEALTKRKIISFRLSDEEYAAVEKKSRKNGFPSISVFARSSTLTERDTDPVSTPLDVELNKLWRRIEAIVTKLEELAALSA